MLNLCSKTTIKKILKSHGLSPSRRLGQNFLINKSVLKKILNQLETGSNCPILEIGPGLGTITQELAKKAQKVVAVEKDPRLIPILKKVLENCDNVVIVQGNILKAEIKNSKFQITDSRQIPNSKFQILNSYKIVGNLPFYLTAPVIRKFLEAKKPPQEMLFIVQKELAQRITAKPPKMNLLALSVQFYAQAKIIASITKTSFWPQPEVDAALIKIIPNFENSSEVPAKKFFSLVRAGFAHPRKKLINNLFKKLDGEKEMFLKHLKDAKIKKEARPENLTIKQWLALTKSLNHFLPPNQNSSFLNSLL